MSNNSFKKPFDKNLFKVYDKKAKEAAPAILKQIPEYKNLLIKENMLTEYGHDLDGLRHFINESGKHCYETEKQVEVEVKRAWKTGKYQFQDIRIPERKRKFLGSDWLVFREDCKAAIFIPAKAIEQSKILPVANKYAPNGDELFFVVQLSECLFIEVKDDSDLY